ncbi:MAG TPA: cupin domain-containing protein [Candidatus Sulfotelmatobacter sp.]|nr:cupin domain-containing protein [Candidatus Sulfotelmatobacter sp.]
MKDHRDAGYWIEKLGLERHPEGGYYRQTYRAQDTIAREALPLRYSGARAAATGIYFLLREGEFSAFHRLRSDEMWHFYQGSPLLVHVIEPAGEYWTIRLGSEAEKGEVFQAVVKAGCWFGSELVDPDSYALVGCTVAPGFDFEDFELGKRLELVRAYPRHRRLIERLTRE